MGDQWESLPEAIFFLIVEIFQTLEDLIRVSFVCKSWRSMTDSVILHRFEKKKLPLLIVPYDHKGGGGGGGSKKEKKLLGYSNIVCDDTLGFISLFDDDDDDDDQLNKKKKKGVYKLYLPEIVDRRICGSSEGWLVTIHKNGEIQLLNPITRVLVHLPPLSTAFPRFVFKLYFEKENYCYRFLGNRLFRVYDSYHFREFFLLKVVTNSSTANSTITTTTTTTVGVPTVVMAIYGRDRRLAFCRPLSSTGINGIDIIDEQQNKWICCHEELGNNQNGIYNYKGNFYVVNGYEDVTYYKGNFYAVRFNGTVVVVKGLNGPSPFVETIIEEGPEYYYRSHMNNYSCVNYLVVLDSSFSSTGGGGGGGDLLMVIRDVGFKKEDAEENYKELPYITFELRVWKLDFNGEGPSWETVTNLGEDCALFVGYNRSFSFSASKFPGCRGNCIYFTDNNWELVYEKRYGGHDMGVYNLEDGSFEYLNYETTTGSSKLFMPPPIWYVPNSI